MFNLGSFNMLDYLIHKEATEKMLKQLVERIDRIGLRQEALITAWNAYAPIDATTPPPDVAATVEPYDTADFVAIGDKTITKA